MAPDEGPDDGSDEETPLEQVVAGLVMALTFLVGFGLLAVGYPWFWIAFPVGFAGVLPAAIGLVRLYESRRASPDEPERDALEALRERYVRGRSTRRSSRSAWRCSWRRNRCPRRGRTRRVGAWSGSRNSTGSPATSESRHRVAGP